ncbi:MAG: hypothetical protein ACKVT2_21100 [Saprospiraceae bacterium]
MTIIITDTNIFIDLIQANALDYFFQLDYEICTTDLVVEEVKVPEQQQKLSPHCVSGRLKVLELDSDEIREALALETQWPLKGIVDPSLLLKAIRLNCGVLSGDGNLGKECARRGLEVHGSLWVLREVWVVGLVEAELALSMLENLSRNTRLPADKIEILRREIAGGKA